MEKEILLKTIEKIFDVLSCELPVPTSSNLESCSKDDLQEYYRKVWQIVCDAHELCFEVKQMSYLFKKLNIES